VINIELISVIQPSPLGISDAKDMLATQNMTLIDQGTLGVLIDVTKNADIETINEEVSLTNIAEFSLKRKGIPYITELNGGFCS
jgi:hypothetical protein